ncbi:MAG: adenylate/guanylate cyclase domain-containing protein, partial [Candidatus Riflebacteria bacterium]
NGLLLIFWLVVFFFPLTGIRLVLNIYLQREIDLQFSRDAKALEEEAARFKKDLCFEECISEFVKSADRQSCSMLPTIVNAPELDDFCRNLGLYFTQKYSLSPWTIAILSEKSGDTGFYNSRESLVSFGRRSSKIFLQGLGNANRFDQSGENRFYRQIVSSLFGPTVEIPEAPDVAKPGLLVGQTTEKIVMLYHFLKNEKHEQFKVLFIFREDEKSAALLLNRALNNAGPGMSRKLKILRTFPTNCHWHTAGHFLVSSIPVSSEYLRMGSHKNSSWYNHALNNPVFIKTPGRLPFLVIKKISGRNLVRLYPYSGSISMILLVLGFCGLFLIRKISAGKFPGSSVSERLRMSIFAASILPFTGFFIFYSQFNESFNETFLRSQLQNLENRLLDLELTLKRVERSNRLQILKMVNELKALKTADAIEIEAFLDREFGKLYFGYSLLRNDGLYLERLPDRNLAGEEDYKKFLLAKDLMNAQILKVYEFAGCISESGQKIMSALPSYKTWRAFGSYFVAVDLNAFCKQDGDFYPAKQADSSHFLISSHNLFPEKAGDHVWACLNLVSSSKENVESFLDSRLSTPGFFLQSGKDELVVRTVFRCQDDRMNSIDPTRAWPPSSINDKELRKAAVRVDENRRSESWFVTDKHGLTTIYSVKALPGSLSILVGKSELYLNSLRNSVLLTTFLCIILYSLVLIFLISRVLSADFTYPVESLIRAISSIDEGEFQKVSGVHENEFNQLFDQFNLLSESLKQRNLLNRFISDELSETIEKEGRTIIDSGVEKVYRVVMFLNLRNFSSICEAISPEDTVKVLNRFFSVVEPELVKNGGQIEKFIGDAVMVSFSREKCSGRPEIAACSCALAAFNAVSGLKKQLSAESLPEIIPGCGIASGLVIRGRVGAKNRRQDFTLIGDTVNLAARLEAASHQLVEPSILITEDMCELAGDGFVTQFFAEQQVRGKTNFTRVFCLKGEQQV